MSRGAFRILLVLTAMLLVVAVVLRRGDGMSGKPDGVGGPLFPDLAERLDDVAALSVVAPGESFHLQRADGNWTLAERGGYPVQFETLRSALLGMADLSTEQAKTSTPALYSRIGVEDPAAEDADSVLLTASDKDGAELAALIVGKPGPTSGTRYVRRAGDKRAWLASGAPNPPRTPTDWLDRALPAIEGKDVREARVTAADGAQVVVSRPVKEQPDFELQDVPEGMQPVSSTAGRRLGTALERLEFQDVAPAAERELSEEDRAVAEFLTWDGLRVVATTAPDGAGYLLRLAVDTLPDAEDSAVARAKTLSAQLDPWVFELAGYRANNLRLGPDDVLEPIPEPEPEPEAGAEAPTEPLIEPLTEPAPATEGDG